MMLNKNNNNISTFSMTSKTVFIRSDPDQVFGVSDLGQDLVHLNIDPKD